ncbi:hypothetical protein ACTXT7_017034, partial [Hymenolepis weldensis]
MATREDEDVQHYMGSLTDFALVSDLVLSKGTSSEASFSFLAPNLLALLRFGSSFCSTYTLNSISDELGDLKITDHLSAEGTRSPSYIHPTDIRSSHPQDFDFAENITVIETAPYKDVAARTATKMVTRKASAESLLRAVQRDRTRAIRE